MSALEGLRLAADMLEGLADDKARGGGSLEYCYGILHSVQNLRAEIARLEKEQRGAALLAHGELSAKADEARLETIAAPHQSAAPQVRRKEQVEGCAPMFPPSAAAADQHAAPSGAGQNAGEQGGVSGAETTASQVAPASPAPAILWGEPTQLWDGRWVRYGSSTGTVVDATAAGEPSAKVPEGWLPKWREALEWYADQDRWICYDDKKASEIRAGDAWEIAANALAAAPQKEGK